MVDSSQIISFIQEQYGTSSMIPLHAPVFPGNEKKYLNECIDTTFVSSVGPFVDQFEVEIGKWSGTARGVGVVNGTAALQIAMKLAGVENGDEVITQALTFVATTNAIAYLGASPVFVDVDLDTMGLSPAKLEHFLIQNAEIRDGKCYNMGTGKKIAACVPMHTFGFPVHMDALIKVCAEWKIPIVEDAAEAIGSYYHDEPCGALGELGIYSFNGNKIITSGGGGAIVSQNDELVARAKYLTTTAKKPHAYEYEHSELGYNFRMPNINAALLCAQLESLPLFLEKKRQLAQKYRDFFEGTDIKFRWETEGTKANFWLNAIELQDRASRDSFLEQTNQAGVMTRPVWTLMFKLPMYENCERDDQTNAQYLEDRIVNIPSSVIL